MLIQKILLAYEPKRENLLRVIKEINKQFGKFDAKMAKEVASFFDMSPAAVYSAASFYDEIKKDQESNLVIQICDGANCQLKMADKIIQQVEVLLGQKVDDNYNKKIKIEKVSCVGKCLDGPVVIVNGTIFERMTPDRVDDVLRGYVG